MAIDRKVEQATRTMLSHAMRHELDDLAEAMRTAKNSARPPLALPGISVADENLAEWHELSATVQRYMAV